MQSRFLFLALVVGCLGLLLGGCGVTEFSRYEGAQRPFTGSGGTKKIADGIEIWDSGTPPRKFIVVGVIKDTRLTGNVGLLGALAAEARKNGGDAVILRGTQMRYLTTVTSPVQATAQTTGSAYANGPYVNYSGTTNVTYTGGDSTPIYTYDTQAIVIRYVR